MIDKIKAELKKTSFPNDPFDLGRRDALDDCLKWAEELEKDIEAMVKPIPEGLTCICGNCDLRNVRWCEIKQLLRNKESERE